MDKPVFLAALAPFLHEIRQQSPGLKVALKLVGCHPDHLAPEVLKAADLLLNFDAPEADMLRTLELFLK